MEMSANSQVCDNILKLIPAFFMNPEYQAIIVAGLCGVGAWVILSWVLQLIFSIMWPFFLLGGALIAMPSWRQTLAKDVFPKHMQIIKEWTWRQAAGLQLAFGKEKVAT